MSGKVTYELAGREVTISSPDKVFFPERGETKRDLIAYYEAVADPLLAALGDRPVLLERHPDGASGKSFFQKRVPNNAPDWLTTTEVRTVNGTASQALVLADLAHVAWAVNLGCLGFHAWPSRGDDVDHSDELRIDLDPQPGVSREQLREAARALRSLLADDGIDAHLKTSGKRGLHVHVALRPGTWTAYQVRTAAVAVARELERRHPDLMTAAWWKEERGQRVFVDFNQNAPHKTVFGAWCARPRVAGQVSTPIAWDELDDVDADALTIATVPDRVAADGDPWAGMYDAPQDLAPLLARAREDEEAGLPDAPWPPEYPKMPGEATRVAPSRAKDRDPG